MNIKGVPSALSSVKYVNGYLACSSLTRRGVPFTRISHTLSAADADCGPSASLRSFGLLDVVSATPSSASLRAPRIRATLCVLATRGCEKCGLVVVQDCFSMRSPSPGLRPPSPRLRGARGNSHESGGLLPFSPLAGRRCPKGG